MRRECPHIHPFGGWAGQFCSGRIAAKPNTLNRKYEMKAFRIVLATIALAVSYPAMSEVGETNVIDAIASKPDKSHALLLLHQMRPWDTESVELLRKKLAFYSAAISTKSLVQQRPQLNGKKLRVVVLYDEVPTTEAETLFASSKTEFQAMGASLVWGLGQQLIELAEKP